MLLSDNPYRLPQHYKRHVCGPSCSCKHLIFVDISDFWALVLSEIYGYSMPLTTSQAITRVRFICQCWYFNPQWTPGWTINKASSVWTMLVSWNKMCSYYMLKHISGFVEGGGGGDILAPKWPPDLQGSCSLANHCNVSDRSEQNSTKFWHTVCESL
jgi:hypothetical protein